MVDLFRPCRILMRKNTSRFPTKPTAQTTEYTTEMRILRMKAPSALTSMSSKLNLSSTGELRFDAALWLNNSSIIKVNNQPSRLTFYCAQTRRQHRRVSALHRTSMNWRLLLYRCVALPLSHDWSKEACKRSHNHGNERWTPSPWRLGHHSQRVSSLYLWRNAAYVKCVICENNYFFKKIHNKNPDVRHGLSISTGNWTCRDKKQDMTHKDV